MGKDAQMLTGVMLTGVTSREDALNFSPRPDYLFETLEEFLDLI
jgi:hypothetical protein